MKKVYALLLASVLFTLSSGAQNLLNCDFTVAAKACVHQEVKVTYTGGSSPSGFYHWNFDGAVIISGTGQGPFYVRWDTIGEKHVTLIITLEGQTCTATRPVVVVQMPAMFHMTGGGAYVPGTAGVPVGLSGSEVGIVYKLRLNGQYTGVAVVGTGQAISFGPQTVAGHYSAVARVDGSECMREMEGVAIVTANIPPPAPVICMVTFDTATNKNKIIWNKHPGFHISHFNIFRETYQTNVFTKIGEVPYSSYSVYVDPGSDPLVKSDKFKLSATDSAGIEGEKSPFHKTIHLNINPGIFGFNLIWNHYEGFDFLTYRIHRKHMAGAWEVIDSIAGNINSYTDYYTTSGITTYFIEVVRPEPCSPSLKSNEIASVLSNMASAAPLGVEENEQAAILAFPNPVSTRLNILLPAGGDYQVEIMQPGGQTLLKSMARGPKAEFNVSGLVSGLYILRITGNNSVTLRKFVKI